MAKLTKKKKIILVVGLAVVVLAVVLAIILISSQRNDFKYEGWIDCQPVLSESQADLCRRAEAAGYPYIAY